MSALKAYASHIASAMDIRAEARGMSERALIELGLPDVEARDVRALAAVYFGPCLLYTSDAADDCCRV